MSAFCMGETCMRKRLAAALLAAFLPALLLAGCATAPSAQTNATASSEAKTEASTTQKPAQTEAPTTQTAVPTQAAHPTDTPSPNPTPNPDADIKEALAQMDLRQKAAQLLMPELPAGRDALAFAAQAQAGGYVLFAKDVTTEAATRALTDGLRAASGIPPFIGIDEEGGIVSRLHTARLAGYQKPASASEIGKTGDAANALAAGRTIGAALARLGVNLDFAPVCDVLTEPSNTVIGTRAFGGDAALVADMASAFRAGLDDFGVLSAPKHFPGHGGTTGDSHDGFVSVPYDAERLAAVEYVPFARAVAEGVPFIMVGHIAAPNADASGLPASLSPYFMTAVLRGEMGFNGVVVTDAMNMGAITEAYAPGEAAVMAIRAGADIVLMPADFEAALDGIVKAVQAGELPEARVDEAVLRVLRAKRDAGL